MKLNKNIKLLIFQFRLITTIFDDELTFKNYIEEFKTITGIVLKRGSSNEYVCSLNNPKSKPKNEKNPSTNTQNEVLQITSTLEDLGKA